MVGLGHSSKRSKTVSPPSATLAKSIQTSKAIISSVTQTGAARSLESNLPTRTPSPMTAGTRSPESPTQSSPPRAVNGKQATLPAKQGQKKNGPARGRPRRGVVAPKRLRQSDSTHARGESSDEEKTETESDAEDDTDVETEVVLPVTKSHKAKLKGKPKETGWQKKKRLQREALKRNKMLRLSKERTIFIAKRRQQRQLLRQKWQCRRFPFIDLRNLRSCGQSVPLRSLLRGSAMPDSASSAFVGINWRQALNAPTLTPGHKITRARADSKDDDELSVLEHNDRTDEYLVRHLGGKEEWMDLRQDTVVEHANVLWAKIKGHSWWPAQLIRDVTCGKVTKVVQPKAVFFHTGDMARVPANGIADFSGANSCPEPKQIPKIGFEQAISDATYVWETSRHRHWEIQAKKLKLLKLSPLAWLDKSVRVFWPADQQWYQGVVKTYDCSTNRHFVLYRDGHPEWVKMQDQLCVLDSGTAPSQSLAERKRTQDPDWAYNLTTPKQGGNDRRCWECGRALRANGWQGGLSHTDKFAWCVRCGNGCHNNCLLKRDSQHQIDGEWDGPICRACTQCQACERDIKFMSGSKRNAKHKLVGVMCDVCAGCLHLSCMMPPLKSLPSGRWVCPNCVQCRCCGARQSDGSKERLVDCVPDSNSIVLPWRFDCTMCDPCGRRYEEGKYCPICNIVWDVTEDHDKPMIECELCMRWIHIACDGMDNQTQRLVGGRNVKYNCPECVFKEKNEAMTVLLDKLAAFDTLKYFAKPVSDKVAPGYSLIIKTPMDLTTMQRKIKSLRYHSLDDFKHDLNLIWRNAKDYNRPPSAVLNTAIRLQKLAQTLYHADLRVYEQHSGGGGGRILGVDERLLAAEQPDDALVFEEDADEDDDDDDTFHLTDELPRMATWVAEPELRGVDACYICCSFGDWDSMLFCVDCGEAFHMFCLYPDTVVNEERRCSSQWRCVRCRVCLCGVPSSPARPALEAPRRAREDGPQEDKQPLSELLVVCGLCDSARHLACCKPPLLKAPEKDFFCEKCVRCRSCGKQSPGPVGSRWTYNFSLCTPCGALYRNGDFCPICRCVWHRTDVDMVQCEHCQKWHHLACDPLLATLDLANQSYFCPKCVNKTRKVTRKKVTVPSPARFAEAIELPTPAPRDMVPAILQLVCRIQMRRRRVRRRLLLDASRVQRRTAVLGAFETTLSSELRCTFQKYFRSHKIANAKVLKTSFVELRETQQRLMAIEMSPDMDKSKITVLASAKAIHEGSRHPPRIEKMADDLRGILCDLPTRIRPPAPGRLPHARCMSAYVNGTPQKALFHGGSDADEPQSEAHDRQASADVDDDADDDAHADADADDADDDGVGPGKAGTAANVDAADAGAVVDDSSAGVASRGVGAKAGAAAHDTDVGTVSCDRSSTEVKAVGAMVKAEAVGRAGLASHVNAADVRTPKQDVDSGAVFGVLVAAVADARGLESTQPTREAACHTTGMTAPDISDIAHTKPGCNAVNSADHPSAATSNTPTNNTVKPSYGETCKNQSDSRDGLEGKDGNPHKARSNSNDRLEGKDVNPHHNGKDTLEDVKPGRLQNSLSDTPDQASGLAPVHTGGKLAGRDPRVCCLCLKHGDHQTSHTQRPEEGRLLPLGGMRSERHRWVHVQCCFWSSGVTITDQGVATNTRLALKNGRGLVCTHCGAHGASVHCRRNCVTSHVGCASKHDWIFQTDGKACCDMHRSAHSLKHRIKDGRVLRRIVVSNASTQIWTGNEDDIPQQLEAWEARRGKRRKKTRFKARRNAGTQDDYDSDNDAPPHKVFLKLGALAVLCLGDIEPRWRCFHARRYLYPVGFTACRVYWSYITRHHRTLYKCTIKSVACPDSGDGSRKPVFIIQAGDDRDNAIQADSAQAAWLQLRARCCALLQTSPKLAERHSFALNGPYFFGFGHKLALELIEQLPQAGMCSKYVFQQTRQADSMLPARAILRQNLPTCVSGCARAEGYIARHERKVPLKFTPPAPLHYTEETLKPPTPDEISNYNVTRQYRHMKQSQRQVRVGHSPIHQWGLFVTQRLEPKSMVIEYLGEMIRQAVADVREKRYENEGNPSCYMFRIDEDCIIDSTKRGNISRFINHSCDPNCYTRVISVDGHKKIVVFSNRVIEPDQEITYDYFFASEQERISCNCGAFNCAGRLN